MKRAIYTLAVITILAGVVGCAANRRGGLAEPRGVGLIRGSAARAPETAAACDSVDPDCARRGRGGRECPTPETYPGPAAGAVTYPYYTLRGPRDFLDRNPMSIGP